jgi:hypothetical protein
MDSIAILSIVLFVILFPKFCILLLGMLFGFLLF